MKRVMVLSLLVLTVVSFLVTSAFPAAFSLSLVGRWEGKASGVKYDPILGPQYYTNQDVQIRILNQEGDKFFGEIWMDGVYADSFAGVISLGQGIIAGSNTSATFCMPFIDNGWRMTGHWQSTYPDYKEAGKVSVHRVSINPIP